MIAQREQLPKLITQSAESRGERLYPHKSSRIFWALTVLRKEMETIAIDYLSNEKKTTLIDFGCGNMPYRPIFECSVHNYVGCDLNGNEMAERIMEYPGILPCVDNSADFVLSSQVLEHVENPSQYLNEAHRVLANDGLLILSTHGVWRYHPDPKDYWRWTCDGLRLEIQQAGFEILRFRGLMGPESLALQIWQDAVLPRVHWRLKSIFTRYMQWRIRRADVRCRSELRDLDASVYVVVAKKLSSQS